MFVKKLSTQNFCSWHHHLEWNCHFSDPTLETFNKKSFSLLTMSALKLFYAISLFFFKIISSFSSCRLVAIFLFPPVSDLRDKLTSAKCYINHVSYFGGSNELFLSQSFGRKLDLWECAVSHTDGVSTVALFVSLWLMGKAVGLTYHTELPLVLSWISFLPNISSAAHQGTRETARTVGGLKAACPCGAVLVTPALPHLMTSTSAWINWPLAQVRPCKKGSGPSMEQTLDLQTHTLKCMLYRHICKLFLNS